MSTCASVLRFRGGRITLLYSTQPQVGSWPPGPDKIRSLPPAGEKQRVPDSFLCPGECTSSNLPPVNRVKFWTKDMRDIGIVPCDGNNPCYGKCTTSTSWVTATCHNRRWTIEGKCPTERKCQYADGTPFKASLTAAPLHIRGCLSKQQTAC